MGAYTIKPLTSSTWDDFADLAERNNGGGMGGCWCCWFHNTTMAERRACGGGDWRGYKQRLVAEGVAHAALVFDGDLAVGWCEYGTPEELPFVFHRAEVAAAGLPAPDYRITCFTVDRRHRRKGVATAALDGALDLIARAGGGVVETYPQDTPGKKVAASFLYNGTRPMFERAGFRYLYAKGKNHCVMRAIVAPFRS